MDEKGKLILKNFNKSENFQTKIQANDSKDGSDLSLSENCVSLTELINSF